MIDTAIVRKLQIDLISGTSNPIIQWFETLWNKLSIAKIDVLHRGGGERIYYYMDHNVEMPVFYSDKGIFHMDDDNYWMIILMKFNLNYSTIQSISKILIEHHLNESIPDPEIDYDLIKLIDKQLNQYVYGTLHEKTM